MNGATPPRGRASSRRAWALTPPASWGAKRSNPSTPPCRSRRFTARSWAPPLRRWRWSRGSGTDLGSGSSRRCTTRSTKRSASAASAITMPSQQPASCPGWARTNARMGAGSSSTPLSRTSFASSARRRACRSGWTSRGRMGRAWRRTRSSPARRVGGSARYSRRALRWSGRNSSTRPGRPRCAAWTAMSGSKRSMRAHRRRSSNSTIRSTGRCCNPGYRCGCRRRPVLSDTPRTRRMRIARRSSRVWPTRRSLCPTPARRDFRGRWRAFARSTSASSSPGRPAGARLRNTARRLSRSITPTARATSCFTRM